jgi:hypothetical protein
MNRAQALRSVTGPTLHPGERAHEQSGLGRTNERLSDEHGVKACARAVFDVFDTGDPRFSDLQYVRTEKRHHLGRAPFVNVKGAQVTLVHADETRTLL